MRCDHVLCSPSISVDGQRWQIPLMARAQWPEVLAGVRWIGVAASRHAGRWLAVWIVTGTAIRIYVNMETVVARR